MYILSLIRNGLGSFFKCFEQLFSPKKVERPEDTQVSIEKKCKNLTLYDFLIAHFVFLFVVK